MYEVGSLLKLAYDRSGLFPIAKCHIGPDAAPEMGKFIRDKGLPRVMAVSDPHTRLAAMDPVLLALNAAGVQIQEFSFDDPHLDATMERAKDLAKACDSVDAIVGVGSGTVCDLAKQAGSDLKKPVVLFATAASMNGYTSGITAVKLRGLKRTIPCTPALAVFADPDIVCKAPPRMAASGLADYLSKCSAGADWRTAHMLRDEYYDEKALQFYEGILQETLDSAAAIGQGDAQAIGVLLEALILSGLSMLVAGSSAPASGGEHLISHYIDMKSALYGSTHDLHGVQVGVATLHCLRLWERICELDPASLDAKTLAASQPSMDQVKQWAFDDWGEAVGQEVIKQWSEKARSTEDIEIEIARFASSHAAIRESVSRDLLSSTLVEQAIRDAGGPVTPEDTAMPLNEYQNALSRARYIRNRFTVLDLAAELGLS